ncbi:hypothetical protein FXV83_18490 [Bradyrhizobium hipponense]|uniref:Uncharacterized protein n=1 Tax=Bradyrhizobium hipponense TaxID=2605638 RepID=A0A5S4YKP7_9BRAD|nr:hypothetical protein FXV83_18490 [Bradyrhizobium hipponense]
MWRHLARFQPVLPGLRAQLSDTGPHHRHCEELLRRNNPDCLSGGTRDCFAALAMTTNVTARRAGLRWLVSRNEPFGAQSPADA